MSIGARALAFAVALGLGTAALAEPTVHTMNVGKHRLYFQSSPAGPTFAQMQVAVQLFGQELDNIAPPLLTGPFSGGRSMGWSGWWHWEAFAPTQAQLDAAYPNGVYSISALGNNYSFTVNGDAYPNPPHFTLSGGQWVGGKYVIDPAKPFSAVTNAHSSYGSGVDSSIHVFLSGGNFNVFDYQARPSTAPGASAANVTIPAGTMAIGQEFTLAAVFLSHVDQDPGNAERYAFFGAVTMVTIKAESPQTFPLTVSSNITPTVANATATFQPRAQDVGTNASVYVFAVAPASLVQGGTTLAKRERLTWKASGAKADPPVQCVLAQLNASGQLQAVSASALTAFVTGTLQAQGQSVTLLQNVPTPQIAGSAFYIGYGTNAQQMLASGVNQRALSLAGNVACNPRAPQTGWWYNAQEGGRGFSIEAKGKTLFFGAFHYDPDGRAVWNYAGGPTSIDGSLFTAEFIRTSNGQTLTGPYRAPSFATAGSVTLAFSDAVNGTIAWPGGTTAIERLPFVPNGLTAPPQNGLPEAGWWWNPDESGRGFFLEWQNGYFHIAGYMYDEAGRPVWYLSSYASPDPMRIAGNWWLFGNGQAPGQPYRPAQRINDNAGSMEVQFTSSTTGTLTLPDGRRVAFVRMPF